MGAADDARWQSGWRRGVTLLSHLAPDPQAELLAMIWGPRFDRDQALSLLLQWPRVSTSALQVVEKAARRYDSLTPHQQERLRRKALGALQPQHAVVDNAACRASC
jgi:hypothetical protein